jgi:hypothetical protein
MGLRYDGNMAEDKTNVLEGFADSSLSLPRSQGCRLVMLNNAAISFTSKRHTTTDDSTAAAELTEQYLCACDVEGYRNLMQEVGMKQEGPTVIWQDNQAVQILARQGTRSWNENTNVFAYYILKAALAPHMEFLWLFGNGMTETERTNVLCKLTRPELAKLRAKAQQTPTKGISMRMSVETKK